MSREKFSASSNEHKNKESIRNSQEEALAAFDNEAELENELSFGYLKELDSQLNLEEQIVEDFSQSKSSYLRESLIGLRKSGEESLRQLSAKTVNLFNSTKLISKLRDIYIEKRCERINKELSVNNNLAQADDYNSFFKQLQSDFWGKSSQDIETVSSADRALKLILERFPEKKEEILEIWPKLYTRSAARYIKHEFGAYLDHVQGSLYNPDQEIELIKSSDDLLALCFLDKLDFYSKDVNVFEEVEKRLDSVISRYPDLKVLPSQSIHSVLFRFANECPDRIMADSRRVDFLFGLWINNIERDYPTKQESSFLLPIFTDRLKNCSPEESDRIFRRLTATWDNSTFHEEWHWLIDLLPLNKDNLKPTKKNKYWETDPVIVLKRDKILNNDVTDRQPGIMLEAASKFGAGNELVFISNLIANYPDKRYGIDEQVLEEIVDGLLKNYSQRFNINVVHGLAELMKRHSWPDSLKKKIFSANNIDGGVLHNILVDEEPEKYAWIKEEPILLSQLQRDFHKRARGNDLRHYFYEVIDNKRTSNNLDDLIKEYGKSQSFDFEELRSLFLDNKIDRQYISYFIDKIDIKDILVGLDNNIIKEEDRFWLLEAAISYGRARDATLALKELIAAGHIDDLENRKELIDKLTDNVLAKVGIIKDSNCLGSEVLDTSRMVFNEGLRDFLDPEEAGYLGHKMMIGALNFENKSNTTMLVLSNSKKIIEFFPQEEERRDYLSKLFEKLINEPGGEFYSRVISSYFDNRDLLSVLSDEKRLTLEDQIFNLNIIHRCPDLLSSLPSMDARQKSKFATLFANRYQLSPVDSQNRLTLCQKLANTSSFFANEVIFKSMYLQILKDSALTSDEASILYRAEIIFSDRDIRDTFFGNIDRWPALDGTKILETMSGNKERKSSISLDLEEVKKISTAVMKNRGLSPRFWRGYLNSDKADPDFYLDQETFQQGINNIGPDCFNVDGQEMVKFLESLANSEFNFQSKDAQRIIRLACSGSLNIDRITAFYKYDPILMEDILERSFGSSSSFYSNLLGANISYSQEFNKKILDYLFSSMFSESYIDKFLDHGQKNNNTELVGLFKMRLENNNDKQKHLGKLSLLKHDLLDVKESKDFYKEVTSSSTDNVRTQILNSINIIGSMLSNRNNLEQLGEFLDKPGSEDILNLQNISNFINKYSQENKGRSIAVMLFAREYLPDRPLEEVIEKVAYNLRKYGEIIENNSYKNIPIGLRASIGMEYEITSSTDQGYRELTSQASLKSDIAKISEAARIGSGKDAVHEIATRPTDNPYLMLLEMKLLHDIEYIDLNFNRSEKYQKGARGFHLTIGGEKGLSVNQETNFLQNAIISASWGGVQSGETGRKVNGGRGVSLRNRAADDSNNIAFFGEKTNSVELRSLSIDTQETLQRAVTTAFNGSIAIQAFREVFPRGSLETLKLLETAEGRQSIENTLVSQEKTSGELARLWLKLIGQFNTTIKRHNESFLDNESFGYLDDDGVWVDVADFGGEYNKIRFKSIIENIDPTLSLEEYIRTTVIDQEELFKSFSLELSDKLVKINNLYLKPGVSSPDSKGVMQSVFKGDHANAISMLKVTKLSNDELEYYDYDFLDKTVFDAAGEKRKGYYCLQGASELMFTHAVQSALIEFNSKIEKLLN